MGAQFRPSAMSPAANDLGMGDQIKQQQILAEEERKKKLLMQANGLQNIGPGTQALFGISNSI